MKKLMLVLVVLSAFAIPAMPVVAQASIIIGGEGPDYVVCNCMCIPIPGGGKLCGCVCVPVFGAN